MSSIRFRPPRPAPAFYLVFLLLALGSAPAALRGDGPILTEIMAVNEHTLADEDGEYPDWIEIYNTGPGGANLAGWHLTDKAAHPNQWRFPAASLPAGGYLVVFASGKNRVDPARPLHANFKLSGDGGYLALIDPQGNTVSAFAPSYPYQFPGISYGLPQPSTSYQLVASGAAGRLLVPANGALGSTWTGTAFIDSAWTPATLGVGFDTGADYGPLIGTDLDAAMRSKNGTAYLRLPFSLPDPSGIDTLTLRMKYDDGFVAYLNGAEVARRNAPSALAWNSLATGEHGQSASGSMSQDFEGAGTPYALAAYGATIEPVELAGGPAGSFLRLMPDGVADLNNTIGFDRTFGPSEVLVADFDFRMPTEAGHTGCCGERADGFGFALLSTVEYGDSGPGPSGPAPWERPAFPDAFAVGFDIFDGNGTGNTVTLDWNGAEAAAADVTEFQLNSGLFNHCRVTVRKDGFDSLVTLVLTPDSLGTPGADVAVFTDVRVAGLNPFDGRVAFGGRTGGAFVSVDLDNIRLQFLPATSSIAAEEIDLTASRSLLKAGGNVLAVQGLNLTAGDKDFLLAPELDAMDFGNLDPSARQFFSTPTPGGPNLPGVDGVAPDPVFSKPSGAFSANFSLVLSAPAGVTIRYTTSGAEPTAGSTLYGAAIAVNKTMVVKAKGFQAGLLASRTVEGIYLKVDATVAGFDSNLPVVLVDTLGGGLGQTSYTPAWSAFFELGADGRAGTTSAPDFIGYSGLKIRGSSSTGFPKKQFAFETWDSSRLDKKTKILGFPEESDYILYGPYTDKTLMRDALSYGWSNDIGEWAVRTRYVEVFLKTTTGANFTYADYAGVYVLEEKIKRGPDRVNIRKLNPYDNAEPEITGGYIIKKDRLDPGDIGFTTSSGQVLGYVDPKEQEITAPQKAWLTRYLNDFEAALYGPNFLDPVNGYRKYIDVDSFIDGHILVELTKNIDGYRLSAFYHKDRGGKLRLGPAWDYNLTLGNANYLDGWIPQGWYWSLIGDGDYPWFRRLFQDPDFQQRWIDRWTRFRRQQFLTDTLLTTVDDTAFLLDEAQIRNYQEWPILGGYVWPNWYIGGTYTDEVQWMMQWIQDRVEWIDSQYLAAPALSRPGGIIPPGQSLTLSAPAGAIYYTLDGSDPRLSGGAVSPSAHSYNGGGVPVPLAPAGTPLVRAMVPADATLGLSWRQIVFDDSAWKSSTAGLAVGYEGATGYESIIKVDLKTEMQNKNQSAYIRIPFNVDDPTVFASLTLRMKYDDGYVAWINGQEVARRNAVDPIAWNSGASAAHDDTVAVVFEDVDLTAKKGLLKAGANILAIQGMNAGLTSSDFLIIPELDATVVQTGGPIPIDGATRIVARAYQSGSWSGTTEATYVPDAPVPIRLTELLFHPRDPLPPTIYDADDFEFIELQNVSSVPASLLGVRFSAGVTFDFSEGGVPSLGPGEYVLVVKNRTAFAQRYDTADLKIAGEYQGNLDNSGETIVLLDGRGETIHAFRYEDLWYPPADGDGYAIEIIDPAADTASWGLKGSWRLSATVGGSPGSGEPAPTGGFQIPGDANGDGWLDLSDAMAILLDLFAGAGRPLPCGGSSVNDPGNLAVLDTSGDGKVGLTDAVLLLNFLYRNGPAPVLGTGCARIDGCPERCFQ